MHVTTATDPGTPGRPNEDFAALAMPASGQGGALVVLDGVTPHPGGTGCAHGVPWYVARLGGGLLELSLSRPEVTLAQCLAAAISRTANLHTPTCDLSHVYTPQATVVAVRWNADEVEHLVLSDSTLLIEEVSGEVRTVLDDRPPCQRVPKAPQRAFFVAHFQEPPSSRAQRRDGGQGCQRR